MQEEVSQEFVHEEVSQDGQMVMSEYEVDNHQSEMSNDAGHPTKSQNQDPKNIEPGANDRNSEEKRQHFSWRDWPNGQGENHVKGSYGLQWQTEYLRVSQRRVEEAKVKQAKHVQ